MFLLIAKKPESINLDYFACSLELKAVDTIGNYLKYL